MKAFHKIQRELLCFRTIAGRVNVLLERLVRPIVRHVFKQMIDLVHRRAGVTPNTVSLPTHLTGDLSNFEPLRLYQLKHISRAAVDELGAEFHRESEAVISEDPATHTVTCFQNHGFEPCSRELTRSRQTCSACSNHQNARPTGHYEARL